MFLGPLSILGLFGRWEDHLFVYPFLHERKVGMIPPVPFDPQLSSKVGKKDIVHYLHDLDQSLN